MTVPFCFSSVNENSCYSTSLPAFDVLSVWILAILIGMVSHCLNLHFSNGFEHLFIYPFVICISSLVRCLFRFCVYFLTVWTFYYCWILRVVCVFWILVLYQIYFLQIFSLILWLTLNVSWQCLEQKCLILMKSRISILLWILPLVL